MKITFYLCIRTVFKIFLASPTLSKGCVVLTAGVDDVNNGKWKDIECGTTSTTLYGICEYDGAS